MVDTLKGTKKWWESTTVLAGIVIVIAAVCNFLGYDMDIATQSEFQTSLSSVIVGLGGLAVVWRRVKASKKVK